MSERPSPGEQLAGIAGLALILIMFLFAWYGVKDAPINGFDAFDSFGDWINIILVFASFGGMSLAIFGNGVARTPIPISVITTVLAAIGSIVLIIYLISPPGVPGIGEAAIEIELGRKFGIWLGLLASIALTVGGYLSMQEEGASFGSTADHLSDPNAQPHQHEHVTQPPPPPPAHEYDQQAPPPAPQHYDPPPAPPPPQEQYEPPPPGPPPTA